MPGYFTGYAGIYLVGRVLSALMDLATLAGLVWLGYTLYGRRTALLAGALYAFAVLPVQHAHFFVVDSYATIFVVWTLLFCALSFRRGHLWLLLPAGLTTGLAVASKISVWPLAAVVAVAAFLQTLRGRPDPRETAAGDSSTNLRKAQALAALALAGILAAVTFRVAQPYAFQGPGFFGIRLNPSWLGTMRDTLALMSGLRDVPYGDQWTARLPIIFPWTNMVVWGLGLPLGLGAWAGWGWMGWELIRRRRLVHLLPWVWGTGFFLYQATQWVKSMRYLLPVYPVFVLFAAWLVVRLASRGVQRASRDGEETAPPSPSRFRSPAPLSVGKLWLAVPGVLLLATALWCGAFLSIYDHPVTRIDASRWIFDNVPTAVTLRTVDGSTINAPLQPGTVLSSDDGGGEVHLRLDLAQDQQIASVILPKVSGDGAPGLRSLAATLLSASASVDADLPDSGYVPVELTFDTPVSVDAASGVVLSLALTGGAPVTLQASVIANEHWDDPLPLRMDGKDPFWNWYASLSSSPSGQMNNYDDDTAQKRQDLFDWLDEADYIVLSSNRLYASIPRLPLRYPMTTAYYEALLDGSLGFELAAEFVSYPALGACQFPDQENPFAVTQPVYTNALPCSVALPPAEEAFSVYDHPTVMIFHKTSAYSRALAEMLLPRSLTDNVEWMTPRQATLGFLQQDDGGYGTLLSSARMRLEQEQGGTWSDIFNRLAPQNVSERVAVVVWALMLTLLGWIAFPFVYVALPNLRHGAYGLGRVVGLLVWSYVGWLLASLHVLPHTRAVLWLVVLILAVAAGWIAYRHRVAMRELLREKWREIVFVDAIFLTLFLIWVGVRWLNPDLWHPVTGGEKPMDFAYLNAVIRSTWFPPYDPWFAGGNLNYYYFGFVMMGSLTKALGIVPNVAYNLAVPTLFALTGVGAYVVASNLAGGSDARGRRAGLWGILLVLILGNLGEVRLIFNGLVQVGSVHFESLIPGYPQVVSFFAGLWKVVVKGAALPFRRETWYWDATRIIPAGPGEAAGPINEFPLFTYLYADLHAHAMALPLTQVALAVALQWGLGAVSRVRAAGSGMAGVVRRIGAATLPQPASSLLLAALVGGALLATNTWDYPTYLALMTVGLWIGLGSRWAAERWSGGAVESGDDGPSDVPPASGVTASTSMWHFLVPALATPALLLGLAELFFRPYTAHYRGSYGALVAWTGSRTPLGIYLLMYGQFLFPIGVAAVVGVAGSASRLVTALARGMRPLRAAGPATDLPDTGRSASGPSPMALLLDALLAPLAFGIAALVLLVLLVGYLGVSIAWLAVPLGVLTVLLLTASGAPVERRILWFWVGTALALSLLVEVAVLKGDIGRMNTVFKFHYQVWMLMGLSAAVLLERLVHGASGLLSVIPHSLAKVPRPSQGLLTPGLVAASRVTVGIIALLVFGAGLYTAFAVPAKANDRWVPRHRIPSTEWLTCHTPCRSNRTPRST